MRADVDVGLRRVVPDDRDGDRVLLLGGDRQVHTGEHVGGHVVHTAHPDVTLGLRRLPAEHESVATGEAPAGAAPQVLFKSIEDL